MAIRFATKRDKFRIIKFLKENWNGNNILMNSPLIFEYQYMRQNECGFVLAEDDNGNLCGIKGFIPQNNEREPDIAAALAIVVKGSRPMLNMEMQKYLEKNTSCRMMYSLGLNPNTAARIYPLFGYKVDKLQQYYRLGKMDNYQIANIIDKNIPMVVEGDLKLMPLESMEVLLQHFTPEEYRQNFPYKDKQYIQYRYYNHPIYQYQIYGTTNGSNKVTSLLITRKIECSGRSVTRIVDFIGRREDIAGLGWEIDRILEDNQAEYIDFYCYGMKKEWMKKAGFLLRDNDDSNIIPNYFEPFVQKNVDITFFCNLQKDFLICKADGDQDRPSQLPAQL